MTKINNQTGSFAMRLKSSVKSRTDGQKRDLILPLTSWQTCSNNPTVGPPARSMHERDLCAVYNCRFQQENPSVWIVLWWWPDAYACLYLQKKFPMPRFLQ